MNSDDVASMIMDTNLNILFIIFQRKHFQIFGLLAEVMHVRLSANKGFSADSFHCTTRKGFFCIFHSYLLFAGGGFTLSPLQVFPVCWKQNKVSKSFSINTSVSLLIWYPWKGSVSQKLLTIFFFKLTVRHFFDLFICFPHYSSLKKCLLCSLWGSVQSIFNKEMEICLTKKLQYNLKE